MSHSLNKLKKEFLSKTKKICFVHGLTGMAPKHTTSYMSKRAYKEQENHPEAVVFVGDRAGPENHVTNLCHELAHFVEIEDYRMTRYNWGLTVPSVYIVDRLCVEPRTTQITEREIRVAAYQYNLLNYIGCKRTIKNLVSSYQYLPDFMLVPLEDGTMPYGEEGKITKLPYEKIDKSRLKWIENRTRDILKDYSVDRFISEWERKIKILENMKLELNHD